MTISDQTTQLYLDEVREIHQDWETGRLACPQPDGPCIKCQTRADDAAKCIPGLLAEAERLCYERNEANGHIGDLNDEIGRLRALVAAVDAPTEAGTR